MGAMVTYGTSWSSMGSCRGGWGASTLPSLVSARGGHGDPYDTWELIEDVVQVDRYKADSYHPFSNQMGLL